MPSSSPGAGEGENPAGHCGGGHQRFEALHRRLLQEHEAEVEALRREIDRLRGALTAGGELPAGRALPAGSKGAARVEGLSSVEEIPARSPRMFQDVPLHMMAPPEAAVAATPDMASADAASIPPESAAAMTPAASAEGVAQEDPHIPCGRQPLQPRWQHLRGDSSSSIQRSMSSTTSSHLFPPSCNRMQVTHTATDYVRSVHQAELLRSSANRETLSRSSQSDVLLRSSSNRKLVNVQHEIPFSCLIVGNAIFVGWSTAAEAQGTPFPIELIIVQRVITCLGFLIELCARVRKETLRGFTLGSHRAINWFDLVVTLGLISELVLLFFRSNLVAESIYQLSSLRILRLCQLVRLMDLSRRTSFFRELRVFTITFRKSLVALSWVMLLMSTIVYGMAVFLLSVAMDACIGDEHPPVNMGNTAEFPGPPLCKYFGSLGVSLLTIFKVMYGGLLWGEVVDVLQAAGTGYQVLFTAFMVLMVFLVGNIVTGLVIRIAHSARTRQRDDQISDEIRKRHENTLALRDIFWEVDINKTGEITKDELEMACQDVHIDALLASLGLRIFDVERLFDFIDFSGAGVVSMEEFILAFERMQGGARAVDMMLLQGKVSQMFQYVRDLHSCRLMEVGPAEPSPLPEPSSSPSTGKWEGAHVGKLTRGESMRSSTSLAEFVMTFQRGQQGEGAAASVIEQAEMRAMTLSELRELEAIVKMGCSSDGWVHQETAAFLSPGEVDMYAIVYNFIGPYTAPQGIRLIGLSKGWYEKGQLVEQAGTHAIGRVSMDSEGPDVDVDVLRGFFRAQRGPVSIEKVEHGVPQRVEVPTSLSYKEFLGGGPQKPLWFCTHWWGEAVLDFIACVQEHATSRALNDASYWICGYALRQNCSAGLSDFKMDEVTQTPFFKAMDLAVGTLLVVDSHANVFNRIWCDFELYVNLTNRRLLDIVTMQEDCTGRKAQLFSGMRLPYETLSDQRKREKQFPLSIFMAGLRVKLEDGKASRDNDHEIILEFFGKGSGSALEEANQRLRSLFAKAVWPKALDLGIVEDFDSNNPGEISLPAVLRADEQRRELSLSFVLMQGVNSAAVRALAQGLPPLLEELELSFAGCKEVNDQALWDLARGLPQGLRVLSLDFLGCKAITDAGIGVLASAFPAQLTQLTLHFDRCSCITSKSLHTLADHIPKAVQDFQATFHGTMINATFNSVSGLRHAAFPKAAKQRLATVLSKSNIRLPKPGGDSG